MSQQLLPRLRFPEFRGEWQMKKVGELGNVITGSTPPTADRSNYGTDFDFVSPGDMNSGRYVSDSKSKLSRIGFANSRVVAEGSTLVVCIGSTIGKVAQTRKTIATNQQINSIVPDGESDADFIYLSITRLSKKIAILAGRQAVPLLSKNDFSKIKVCLPDRPEQERIAGFLTSVDEKITELQKKKEAIEKYKKGMMQAIFSQKIRFKDENGQSYPTWHPKKLGDIAKFFRGQTYSSGNVKPDGNLVLRSSNIQAGKLVLDSDLQFVDKSIADEIKLRSRDIVICMSNGSKKLVGKTGVYNGGYEGGITAGAFCSICRGKSRILPYIFQTLQYKKYLHIMLSGTNINNLNNSDLERLIFTIPSEDKETNKIADFLTTIDEKINLAERELEKAKQFKKALLQQMFI